MAKNPSGRDDSLDGMSAEVDRLLKQLPGADPTLRGSGAMSPTRSGPSPALGPVMAGGSAVKSGPRESTPRDKLGAWLKAGLGVLVGAVMPLWPYAHGCGLGLYLYLGAVLAVTVAGVWGSVSSWKHRIPVAHVLSLGVILWGLILAASQILPRVGYAATAASWRCL
jgi:VIT1/CCC1 family predicted Fe2+/Mn2+ transporter